MAFYAQTVNVIGAIKTTRTAAEMETTGLVLQLYRQRFGSVPVPVDGEFGEIDVAAALTADGRSLTIGAVNPTTAEVALPLRLLGAVPSAGGVRWLIAAGDERARNTPGKPRTVDIVPAAVPDGASELRVPVLGVAIFDLPLTRPRA
jgi:alpha-N-arabinofuranosidase